MGWRPFPVESRYGTILQDNLMIQKINDRNCAPIALHYQLSIVLY
jgi:hypothetical protein